MAISWAPKDIPSLLGKTALVTGANSGLGFESTRLLLKNGAEVYLWCRNGDKGQQAKALLDSENLMGKSHLIIADLNDLDQVQKGASELSAMLQSLDILINNAGIMAVPQAKTAQGFELQWGINYLAHFYLTQQLWPLLRESKQARVISLSSLAAKRGFINWEDPNFERAFDTWKAYGQSKLAMLKFGLALERRIRAAKLDIRSIPVHPGIANTALFDHLAAQIPSWAAGILEFTLLPLISHSAEEGSFPQVFAATAIEAKGGQYYGPGGWGERKGRPDLAKIPAQAADLKAQDRLWQLSEEVLGLSFKL
jgi:protochlorophyllide reductase